MLTTHATPAPARPMNATLHLSKGRIIYREGDPASSLHLLHDGYAKLTRISPTSREIIVDYVGPGEMLGNLNPQGISRYAETAELITDTTLEALDPHTIYTTPVLRDRASEQAQAARERLSDRVMLIDLQVPARFLMYLLDAGKRFGTRKGDLTVVETPFTHDDLAALLHSRRVTITHTIRQLANDGLLTRDRHIYTFHPPTLEDALLDLATN